MKVQATKVFVAEPENALGKSRGGWTSSHVVSCFPDWSVGHGNGTCRTTCVQFTEDSYLLAWMEFRDRSTHAVREREVLYRLIVR